MLASKNNPVPIRVPRSGNAEVDRFNQDMKNTSFVLWHALFDVVAVPATAASPGVEGQMAYDANYIYRCVATDTWKRVAIATW